MRRKGPNAASKKKFSIQLIEDEEEKKQNPLEFGDSDLDEGEIQNPDLFKKEQQSNDGSEDVIVSKNHQEQEFDSQEHFEKVQPPHNDSEGSSSQNEEEKKEQQQYQVLKQSLKALQERANSTIREKNGSDFAQMSISSDKSDQQDFKIVPSDEEAKQISCSDHQESDTDGPDKIDASYVQTEAHDSEEESKTLNEKVKEKKRQTQQLLIRNNGGGSLTAAGGMPNSTLTKISSQQKIGGKSAQSSEISKGLASLKQRKTMGNIPSQIHSNNQN